MTERIKEKIVVVAGASSGLGEATARLLLAPGATVVLSVHRPDRLKAVLRQPQDMDINEIVFRPTAQEL